MSQKIQLRRGPTAARTQIIPDQGEPCWDTEAQRLFIGDGTTPGGAPVVPAALEAAPRFLPQITKLTGGTQDALDALDPAEFSPGDRVQIEVTQADFDEVLMTFKLKNTPTTEASPNIITPDPAPTWHWKRIS